MLGYDYEIIYKKGKDNILEDSLSQQYEDEGSLLSLLEPIPDWLNQARQEWIEDPYIAQLINKIKTNPNLPHGYSWTERTLKYKCQFVLIPTSDMKTQILQELHSFSIPGHLGFQKTCAHARCSFFWPSMTKDI